MKEYDDERQIAIIWCIEDVRHSYQECGSDQEFDLTDEECMDILSYVENKHDANYGIGWMTLEMAVQYLYPDFKLKDREE